MMEQGKPRLKQAAVVINPSKSSAESFTAEFNALCESEGWAPPLLLETTVEDPGVGQAREALAAGVDLVVAAGGDGTARAVAEVLSGSETPLGIAPLGTGNLLARNLAIDVNGPTSAGGWLLNGELKKIDVVKVRLDHAADEKTFLVMAGVGYDAIIMSDTDDELKDRVGWLAYVDAGIRHLPGRPVKATLTIDGKVVMKRRVRSIMIGNCGKIMGGIEIFPGAKIDDGVFDVVVLAPTGSFGWLNVLGAIFSRRNANQSVGQFTGKSAEIQLERAQECQLDGDACAETRQLEVRIEPLALNVKIPG